METGRLGGSGVSLTEGTSRGEETDEDDDGVLAL